jgi:oligoendopeptidase F
MGTTTLLQRSSVESRYLWNAESCFVDRAAWRAEQPCLAVYAHYFDNLFRRQAHVRSAEVEEVRAHLFDREKDTQFQIALIEEAMDNLHRYFFIMPTLARFELEMHDRVEKGWAVNADDMNHLMADLFSEGYGGELELDLEREGSTWAQFGHLYMNFYVFQYATGIGAAHALAGPILAGDTGAASRYLEFLSAGSSLYPVEALNRAGVDMTGPRAIEKCFAVVEGLVDRLERLTSAKD